MSKNHNEPWKNELWTCGTIPESEDCVIGFDGVLCIRVVHRPGQDTKGIAKRVVECVNVCRGYTIRDLEKILPEMEI